MNKIRAYFDALAPQWDEVSVHDPQKIRSILHSCHLSKKSRVLDIACGTGVLAPFLLEWEPASVTGIDLSPKMIDIAQKKYGDRVTYICQDVLEYTSGPFDVCIVYSAFPHFLEPERLLEKANSLLSSSGRLVIAHSQSREQINSIHGGSASQVSRGLMEASQMAELMEPWFAVEEIVDDEQMYLVCGRKK